MSTLKVNKIENTATTDGGIEIDSDGHVQLDGVQLPTTGPLSNRNLIINGAMQVAQRGTVTGITSQPTYGGPDRFDLRAGDHGTFSLEQSTDAPDGFSNSLKVSCTTADGDLTDGSLNLVQHIEGQNLQHLKWGTANAEKVTLSFYAKANAAEDITVNLRDIDNGTLVGSTVSLTTSWTKYTITFAAQTSGSGMDNNNGDSLWVEWWLGQGTDGTYTSGSVNSTWTAHAASNRGAGNTFVIGDSTSNEFYLTGVQLEVGDKATPFEHRSYGDEFTRCQRYYYRLDRVTQHDARFLSGYAVGSGTARFLIDLPNNFRERPTAIETSGTAADYKATRSNGAGSVASAVPTFHTASRTTMSIQLTTANTSHLSAGNASMMTMENTGTGFIGVSAEL